MRFYLQSLSKTFVALIFVVFAVPIALANSSDQSERKEKQRQSCIRSLRTFALIDPSVTDNQLALQEVETLELKSDVIEGETTGTQYHIFGRVLKNKMNGYQINFDYPFRFPVEGLEPQNVVIYPGLRDEKSHIMWIDLDRDHVTQQWTDLNIVGPVLSHMFSLMENDESLEIPIADPILVKELTEHLVRYLEGFQFSYAMPRTARSDSQKPKIKTNEWDENQDVVLPAIPKPELDSLLMRIREEAGMEAVLHRLLENHPLGKLIRENGGFEVSFLLDGLYREYAETEEELQSLEDDPYRMIPAALRYKIVLKPAW